MLICLVVAGSLLGNGFVASRMTVAAANSRWIPQVFTVVGKLGTKPASDSSSDAPINAIVLSTILAAIYILFGNFRALITLNGLGEYSFFFFTVLGAAILRYREPQLVRPYKPWILNHIAFLLVSGFVVARGAVFAPFQAIVIISLWILGLAFYYARQRNLI
jgi:L-type amino acid transporter 9